jgi:hypothetical protein
MLLGLVLAALGGAAATYPMWRPKPTLPPLTLGHVSDVLGEEVAAQEFLGAFPVVVHVGPPSAVETLLAARRGGDTATIVDTSTLDPVSRETLTARLVEAALEDGGAIAVDSAGVTVRQLAGSLDGAVRVEVDAGGHVASRRPIDGQVSGGD